MVGVPAHNVAEEGLMLIVGKAFTTIVIVWEFTHPVVAVPVTVYVVVTEGLATGLGQLLQLNPVAGDQP